MSALRLVFGSSALSNLVCSFGRIADRARLNASCRSLSRALHKECPDSKREVKRQLTAMRDAIVPDPAFWIALRNSGGVISGSHLLWTIDGNSAWKPSDTDILLPGNGQPCPLTNEKHQLAKKELEKSDIWRYCKAHLHPHSNSNPSVEASSDYQDVLLTSNWMMGDATLPTKQLIVCPMRTESGKSIPQGKASRDDMDRYIQASFPSGVSKFSFDGKTLICLDQNVILNRTFVMRAPRTSPEVCKTILLGHKWRLRGYTDVTPATDLAENKISRDLLEKLNRQEARESILRIWNNIPGVDATYVKLLDASLNTLRLTDRREELNRNCLRAVLLLLARHLRCTEQDLEVTNAHLRELMLILNWAAHGRIPTPPAIEEHETKKPDHKVAKRPLLSDVSRNGRLVESSSKRVKS